MSDGAEQLRLSYAVMERVIAGMHSVGEDQHSALRGRMKYFQRMGFPADRPKRGARTGYSLEDLLQLVLAFELLECGVAPVRAARAARTNWQFNRGAFARAAQGARSFLAMHPRALVELVDLSADAGDPVADPFGTLGPEDVGEWAQRPFVERNAHAERSVLLVDVTRLLSVMWPLLGEHGVDVERFRSSVAALR